MDTKEDIKVSADANVIASNNAEPKPVWKTIFYNSKIRNLSIIDVMSHPKIQDLTYFIYCFNPEITNASQLSGWVSVDVTMVLQKLKPDIDANTSDAIAYYATEQALEKYSAIFKLEKKSIMDLLV